MLESYDNVYDNYAGGLKPTLTLTCTYTSNIKIL